MEKAKLIWESIQDEVSWDELSKEQQLQFDALIKCGGDETPKGLLVREYLANETEQPAEEVETVGFLDAQNHPEFNESAPVEVGEVVFQDGVNAEVEKVEDFQAQNAFIEIPTVESVIKNHKKEELLTWAKSLELDVTEDNNKQELAERIVAKLSE